MYRRQVLHRFFGNGNFFTYRQIVQDSCGDPVPIMTQWRRWVFVRVRHFYNSDRVDVTFESNVDGLYQQTLIRVREGTKVALGGTFSGI